MRNSLILAAVILLLACSAQGDFGVSRFTNPICGAADPCIVKNPEGPGYWYVYTSYTAVFCEYALTPADFKYDHSNKIFEGVTGTKYEKEFWAPELHRIDGKWYIYFTAADETGLHRMFAVSGGDPMKPFGDIVDMGSSNGKHAIDQTVFRHGNKLYTCYSAFEEGQTFLMLAEMASPTKIKDKRVRISFPEYEWEKVRYPTNEGPYAIERNGKLHIIYSAAAGFNDS